MYYFSEDGYLTPEEQKAIEEQHKAVLEYVQRKRKEQEEEQKMLEQLKANFV